MIGVFDFMILSLLGYLGLILFPRKNSNQAVFAACFGFLSYLHIKRMIEDYGGWRVDTATMCMIQVCKITSVGFAYRDGEVTKDEEDKLFSHQVKAKLVERPTFLEYFSYNFSCCGCMLGPYFEYKDFINLMNRSGDYEKIPNTVLPSLKIYGQAIVLLALFAGVQILLPPNFIFTEDFGEKNFFYQFGYMYLSLSNRRFQFYAAFRLLESSAVASGLGFNGYVDKVPQWDRVICGYAWLIETVSDPSLVIKNNIFFRSFRKGESPGFQTNLIVMLVSALWHGFYPIYYIVFIQLAILVEIAKDVQRYGSFVNKLVPNSIVRYLLAQLFTKYIYSYLILIHFALLLDKAWIGVKNLKFIPPLMLLSLFLAFKVIVPRVAKRDVKHIIQNANTIATKKDN
ncbi:UNKNOWN [Stylonychia lemnae]|uniref:Mboat family protein n=1 Tax=Stylonychia lemnae TaxID=5949 RepID=A0A078AJL1_STYLE|nr:UNKNOWN [Stylonychia lemnae]|eukprot:CDW82076.1 UNKNOWN [Stylonychia lemnae]